MSSETIPATAAQIDARMLVKHMWQAPDDWARHEALAERALLAAEQRGLEMAADEMERRARENANTPETKAAYRNALAAIRSLGDKT